MNKTIGVFDSGVGGLSLVNAIKKDLPNLEVIYADDKKHVPYGTKPISQIKSYVIPILNNLVEQGCEVIVIACNTVTTNIIDELRQIMQVPLIGMEPMVKPASSITKTQIITVCATPATLKSKRYAWLKDQYAKGVEVLEPDCSNWSYMIENKQIDRDKIARIINNSCNRGSDVIVLGCTHYHWIEELINQLAKGRAQIIQPEKPVIEQLCRVLLI
jgi:glutamate racemase